MVKKSDWICFAIFVVLLILAFVIPGYTMKIIAVIFGMSYVTYRFFENVDFDF